MKSPSESFPPQQESSKVFEALYKKLLSAKGDFIEYNSSRPKVDFLRFLAKKQEFLFHGSNLNVPQLEPRPANCKSKKFGNLNAVYATEDEIVPVFFAIKDRHKFHGMAVSGFTERNHGADDARKVYNFEIDPQMLVGQPWSQGVIYVLLKSSFEQGTDDAGNTIDEWISRTEVRPLAKLEVGPEDFPYLQSIKPISK